MSKQISTVRDVVFSQMFLQTDGGNTAAEALKMMDENRKHAVGITNKDGAFCGLFTHGDFIRRVVCRGLNPNAVRLEDVMTVNPQTVEPGCPLREAFEIMCRRKISHLPVVKDGRFFGMLSEDDLKPEIANDLKRLAKDYNLLLNYAYGGFYALGAIW